MRRASFFVLIVGLLLIPATALGQSGSASSFSDSQTLQALLQEVRHLRQDVRTVTVVSERSQILLARLQAQETAVEGAQKELDNARSQVDQAQKHQNGLENQLQYYKDQDTEERTPDSAQRQKLETLIPRYKSSVDEAGAETQKAETAEMQAKDKLQIERSKLDTLQDELDRLDQSLKSLASQPVN